LEIAGKESRYQTREIFSQKRKINPRINDIGFIHILLKMEIETVNGISLNSSPGQSFCNVSYAALTELYNVFS